MLSELEKKINSKVKAIEKNPQLMLCEQMSGKMSDCKSITSSSADNSTCQGRINKAIEDIRNYSPSCHFDADNRYPDELAPCEYESDNDNLTGGAY